MTARIAITCLLILLALPNGFGVEDGLRQLRIRQLSDGSLPGTVECPDQLYQTAGATLSWLGAGYDHKTPNKYRKDVQAALTWMVSRPRDTQGLCSDELAIHALVTMACNEAYAMTMDPALKAHAVDLTTALVSQQQEDGWWPVRPESDTADLRSTCFATMACKSASAGGMAVGDPPLKKVGAWARTELNIRELNGDITTLGQLLLINVFTGRKADEQTTRIITRALTDPQVILFDIGAEERYLWTLVIFQLGGKHWQAFADRAQPLLIELVTGVNTETNKPYPRHWADLLSLEIWYRYIRVSK